MMAGFLAGCAPSQGSGLSHIQHPLSSALIFSIIAAAAAFFLTMKHHGQDTPDNKRKSWMGEVVRFIEGRRWTNSLQKRFKVRVRWLASPEEFKKKLDQLGIDTVRTRDTEAIMEWISLSEAVLWTHRQFDDPLRLLELFTEDAGVDAFQGTVGLISEEKQLLEAKIIELARPLKQSSLYTEHLAIRDKVFAGARGAMTQKAVQLLEGRLWRAEKDFGPHQQTLFRVRFGRKGHEREGETTIDYVQPTLAKHILYVSGRYRSVVVLLESALYSLRYSEKVILIRSIAEIQEHLSRKSPARRSAKSQQPGPISNAVTRDLVQRFIPPFRFYR